MMANDNRAKREQLRVFEARQVLQGTKKKRTRGDQWKWTASAIGAVVVASLALAAYSTIGPGTPAQVPDASLSENREWSGQLTISGVVMDITLDGVRAPQATANFVSLAQEGFFDQTACHRLTTEGIFVLQCGDPLGSGLGGPGYVFGPVENAPANNLYSRGTLAMARADNDGQSHGSQFFIVYEDSTIRSDLAGGYTVLGTVTAGVDELVDAFVTPGTVDGSPDGRPTVVPEIQSITIR
jgi:peptidyl-prolyl cis-trans isomerase B (cyclophilin B)